MKRFTIAEFQKYCNLTSYNGAIKRIESITSRVNAGKLTGEINLTEENIDGKYIKVLYISENLLDSMLTVKINETEPVSEPISEVQFTQTNQLSAEFIERTLSELIATKNQLINYAEKVGQVKLLTDSENKTKEEYFKIVQDNAVLNNKVNQLELINKQLETENQQLKQKSFFGIKFGK